MSTEVVMPQMGESIAEGTIVRWIKKIGDPIDKDEPLFDFAREPGEPVHLEELVRRECFRGPWDPGAGFCHRAGGIYRLMRFNSSCPGLLSRPCVDAAGSPRPEACQA
jgi:hypothetical protein